MKEIIAKTIVTNRLLCKVILAGFFIAASGCAGYSIVRDGTGDGYDIYQPEPYILLVAGSEDGKDKTTASLVWLPNFSKRYRVHTWNFMAKADFDFHFEDGWKLTAISEKGDTTALPAAILEALTKAAATFVKGPTQIPQVKLYRIVFDETKGYASSLMEIK